MSLFSFSGKNQKILNMKHQKCWHRVSKQQSNNFVAGAFIYSFPKPNILVEKWNMLSLQVHYQHCCVMLKEDCFNNSIFLSGTASSLSLRLQIVIDNVGGEGGLPSCLEVHSKCMHAKAAWTNFFNWMCSWPQLCVNLN